MTLRDDVDAGLAAVGTSDGQTPLALDKRGACVVTVPVPKQVVALTDEKLLVQVQLGPGGRHFSLRSPLARLRETPDAALGEALLQRHYYPSPIGGLSFALSPEDDTLVACYHWILDRIDVSQFEAVFTAFTTGIFGLVVEIASMARNDGSLQPIHPDAS